MAYIQRDQHGKITAVFDTAQANAQESLLADDPELLDYLVNSADLDDARTILSTSDIDLIRVLEDLVNTLIDQKVILFTDLPLAAREKLASRERIRGHLHSLDNLMADEQGIL
ncbi:hypothetical protein A9Q79_07770 [Methylophaga sp. 42_25_T18]|nr:hypothetical protein A9Q79_07770 [Methylophaga sp. 42_25_T18]OUR86992.1 hypothetical protein A9Q92_04990 [Methylophaga sp. 42_8_T64]